MTSLARLLTVRLVTAVAVLLGPMAMARAQESAGGSVTGVETRFVTPMTVAFAQLRPAQVMAAPIAQMLPIEVAEAAGQKFLGIDPKDIRLVTVVVEAPPGPAPPNYGVIFELENPFSPAKFAPELIGHTERAKLGERTYLKSRDPNLPSLYPIDTKTLLVGSEGMVKKLAKGEQAAEGSFVDDLKAHGGADDFFLALDLQALRPFVQMGVGAGGQQVPPQYRKYLQIPMLLRGAEASLNLSSGRVSGLVVRADDASSAEEVEKLVADGIAEARAQAEAPAQMLLASDDPIQQAFGKYSLRMNKQFYDGLSLTADGDTMTLISGNLAAGELGDANASALMQQQLVIVAVIGILIALLLPAVQAAREAARRSQSTNNMKQLMLALHNYHDVHNGFPPAAIFSDDGEPLLSWRVAILPFVEEQALYEQFHLDEPWDSEHNKQLIPLMPQTFLDPSSVLSPEEGRSCYAAVTGEGYLMSGGADGTGMRNITDGTSNTVALVEVSDEAAPVWTQPGDWTPDEDDPLAGLGSRHPQGFIVGFCDGSVHFMSQDIDLDTWLALLTIGGGEVVQVP
ncbi:hypothetical protein Pla175_11460 [Pirellulimonas nuda]|uniref:DUF1559 domain-containing protein n=1 Tax=Pirellulimonas nuda TaxID=2528009 RepID=A0A518D8G8_9BACT|nr:DUF1559 domain-containing protein [Pirellulimonas nuda]QDU87779.1 hypothetical protein Pla175_11460 [Pirellulimonas nuda]